MVIDHMIEESSCYKHMTVCSMKCKKTNQSLVLYHCSYLTNCLSTLLPYKEMGDYHIKLLQYSALLLVQWPLLNCITKHSNIIHTTSVAILCIRYSRIVQEDEGSNLPFQPHSNVYNVHYLGQTSQTCSSSHSPQVIILTIQSIGCHQSVHIHLIKHYQKCGHVWYANICGDFL